MSPRAARPRAAVPPAYFRGVAPSGSSVELYEEDCRPGLRTRVPAGSLDVVVTSPPYNLGIAYGQYQDRRPRDSYLEFLREVTGSIDAALAPAGSFFLNVAGAPKDPWLPWDAARIVHEKFELQNVVHWIKSVAIGRAHAGQGAGLSKDLAVGHYKPVRSDRFVHGAHEYVFHFTRTGDVPLDRLSIGVPYQDTSNVGRWEGASGGLRCRGNTWFLPYPTIRRRSTDRPHPATFPPELPEWCLKLHGTKRTRSASDPFLGIGASAIASARLGIPFVGFDIDANYLGIAGDRLRSEGVRERSPAARSAAVPGEV